MVEGTVDPDIVELKEMLAEEGKDRILDVGCGAGRHLLYLAQHGFDVCGFDFSEELDERRDQYCLLARKP